MAEPRSAIERDAERERRRRAMRLSETTRLERHHVGMDSRPVAVDDRELPEADELTLEQLARVYDYEVRTLDNWTLNITRYEPKPQPFPQPILGQPILLVHGFSENSSCWTTGDFLKKLSFFGADLHLLELRGHGKSNAARQIELFEQGQGRLPDDLDYKWDIDSYFMYDVPAAVDAVRRSSGCKRIFYIGHSLGGMLGYGYAGLRDELAGLVAIGSPSDLGRGWLFLRMLARIKPALILGDLGYGVRNAAARTEWAARTSAAWLAERSDLARRVLGEAETPQRPERLQFNRLHLSLAGRLIGRLLRSRGKPMLARWFPALINPARVNLESIQAYFSESSEDEPRKVVEQFARWIREDEMVCYRMKYDFKRGYRNITIPMAIIFGDQDRLTPISSTRSVYNDARSEYLLWRPVRGNSHIEITMGRDLNQICHDIKNLVEYAVRRERKRQ